MTILLTTLIITLRLKKVNKEIDDLLLLTSSMQTQLSVTCECLQVEIKKQLQRTVIKGATETNRGYLEGKNKLYVEKISHSASQNVNKKITT